MVNLPIVQRKIGPRSDSGFCSDEVNHIQSSAGGIFELGYEDDIVVEDLRDYGEAMHWSHTVSMLGKSTALCLFFVA